MKYTSRPNGGKKRNKDRNSYNYYDEDITYRTVE